MAGSKDPLTAFPLPEKVSKDAWDRDRLQVKAVIADMVAPESRRLLRMECKRVVQQGAAAEFSDLVIQHRLESRLLSTCEYVVIAESINAAWDSKVDIGVVPTPLQVEHMVDVVTFNWFNFMAWVSIQHQSVGRKRDRGGAVSGLNPEGFCLAFLLILKEGVERRGSVAITADPRLKWVPSSGSVREQKPPGAKLIVLKQRVLEFVLVAATVCTELY
jgi:hypothetical protein